MASDVDDPIAEAATSDCPYRRASVACHRPVRGPVSRTLARQAGLLVALAFVFPVVATYPDSVGRVVETPVVETFPKVLLVGALGGAVQLLGACALVALVLARAAVDTDRRARRLVALEDLATTVSLGAGGFAIAFTVGYLSLGHLDDALTVATRETTDPLTAVETAVEAGVTVDTVAALALAGALATWAASRWVGARERRPVR